MGIKDKLSAGAERAVKEAEKAFDKGKAKVGELQMEMQMDGLAKKLGYLVFDFYRGREVDQARRQKLLDELSRLEDQLLRARAEAAARARPPAGPGAQGGAGQAGAGAASTPGSDRAGAGEQDSADPQGGQATPPGQS